MSEREPGFYWVKLRDRWIVAEWMPDDARGYPKGWWSVGPDRSFLDRDWDEIGPRIEPPA
jgi:hypothetical protein